jgi:hypothetical protein
MGIGPSHAFSRKAIDVRGGNQPSGRVVAGHIAIAQVVGIQEQDVG